MTPTPSDERTLERRLRGDVADAGDLTADQRRRMFQLLSAYYANTDRDRFDHDLAEKETVVLLHDRGTGELVGFTTIVRVHAEVDGRAVIGIFSGDTIIDRSYWGEGELARTWLRHVLDLRDRTPDAQVYWFLIVSGHSTYRFLPLHFKAFYPTYKRDTPAEIQRRLDALALKKYPHEYDPKTGIVRPREPSPVLPGVADITDRRRQNPHIAFLVERNPGYLRGDEMACLALLERDNLTRVGLRALQGGKANPQSDPAEDDRD